MNWGIYSASGISNRFIDALLAENENVYAVASKSMDKVIEYKNKYNIEKAYGNYGDLLSDGNVDIVYVSNVNTHHCKAVIDSLEAGKHVVCEKPLGISKEEAYKMTECAKRNKKFLMEAMWTRAVPIYKDIHEIINKGEIGRVMRVWADFSFVAGRNIEWRLLNPDLGGGVIYDVGIYSLMIVLDFMGLDVKNIKASGFIGETGVDEEATVLLNYGNGRMGVMSNSFISARPMMCVITGDGGMIKIPGFTGAERAEITFFKNKEKEGYILEKPCFQNKFRYQIQNVIECIKNGKSESDLTPWSHSLKAAEIIDEALFELRGEAD